MRLTRDSDGQSVEVDDNNHRLIDYYVGEGYRAEAVAAVEPVSFPRVFNGERYVDEHGNPQPQVEQMPDGRLVEAPPVPAKSAPKAEWVDYAVSVQAVQGTEAADARTSAEGLTKDELIDQYGG